MIWFDGRNTREKKISMKLCLIDTVTIFMISRPILREPLPMRTLKNGTTSYNFLFVVVGNVMEWGKHFVVEVHSVTGGMVQTTCPNKLTSKHHKIPFSYTARLII